VLLAFATNWTMNELVIAMETSKNATVKLPTIRYLELNLDIYFMYLQKKNLIKLNSREVY